MLVVLVLLNFSGTAAIVLSCPLSMKGYTWSAPVHGALGRFKAWRLEAVVKRMTLRELITATRLKLGIEPMCAAACAPPHWSACNRCFVVSAAL